MDERRTYAEFGASIVVTFDSDGRLTHLNHTAERVFGYAAAEVVGCDWLETFTPEDQRTDVREEFERLIRGESAGDFTGVVIVKGGGTRTIRWQSAAYFDSGAVRAVVGMGIDITDEADHLAVLRDHEYFLSQVQRVANLGCYSFDIPADTWESSDVMDQLFGIGPDYVRDAAGWLAIVHEADREMMGEYLVNLLKNCSSFDKEYRISRIDDGAERFVYGRGELELDADGLPMRLIGTVQDVTDSRRSIAQAAAMAEMLASAEKVGCVGSWRYDYSAESLTCSEQLLAILGHPPDVPLTLERFFDYVHRDDRAAMSKRVANHDQRGVTESDYRIVRPDGVERYVKSRVEVVRQAGGGVPYEVGMLADVTEAKLAEQEVLAYQKRLKQLTRRLEESGDEERRTLAAQLHDVVAQPLAVAKMRLQLIASEASETQSDELKMITDLVSEALDRTRHTMAEIAPAVLHELGLASALDWLCGNLGERFGLVVLLDTDGSLDGLPTSWPQSSVVFRVVRELLMNTVKHAGPCDAAVTATLDDGRLLMVVRDTGRGMCESDPSGEGGFGLMSVRESIEGHGGSFAIESTPGSGTEARFTIPVA